MKGLIFDIGLHLGEHSQFFLNKGYKVVALDANPKFCDFCRNKFISNQFTVINAAIADSESPVEFYVSKHSDWSSCVKEIANRGNNLSETIFVRTITMHKLVKDYGIPYYVKIDIEGHDYLCIQQLKGIKPQYISFESECIGNRAITREEILRNLNAAKSVGYTKFKLVNQVNGRVNNSSYHASQTVLPQELPDEWQDYSTMAALLLNEKREGYTKYCIWADVFATF